eukprot:GHVP01014383.1.p1 GENE.GHVP01014383.1~~GHVP01014383.1.p1  ORF type:complete len:388 (-),score=46.35 GHVP01014383.1:23-1186(-)
MFVGSYHKTYSNITYKKKQKRIGKWKGGGDRFKTKNNTPENVDGTKVDSGKGEGKEVNTPGTWKAGNNEEKRERTENSNTSNSSMVQFSSSQTANNPIHVISPTDGLQTHVKSTIDLDKRKVVISPNPHGSIGLTNPKQVFCFLNVVLQSLFHLPKFRKWIASSTTTLDLLSHLKNLFTKLETQKTHFAVDDIIDTLDLPIAQGDACETLCKIFSGLCSDCELDLSKSSPGWKYTFGETDTSQIALDFMILETTESLENSVKNAYNEGHTPSSILIIQWMSSDTLKYPYLPPSTLNLYADLKKEDCKYILTQVIIRIGPNASSGHYYIYINDPEKDEWTCFNDDVVTKNPFPGQTKYREEEQPCLLVYVRKTDLGDVYSKTRASGDR